jgi:hypothetical protein
LRLSIGRLPVRVSPAAVFLLLAVAAICAQLGSAFPAGATPAEPPARTAEHFACSGPDAAHRRCYFSTPSHDIRCVWTPSPNSVTCELLATRRAYRLRPTGHARAVHVKLTRRGETLPTNQMLVFPDKLSCQDTRVAMTCNQDEGFGEFKLSPHSAHAA